MLIYTGNSDGEKLDRVKELNMGILIASSANRTISRRYREVPCALDNGAFQCFRRGFPFQADVFRRSLANAYQMGVTLDFIVCPDVVAGGMASLEFSMEWRLGELRTAPHIAFVVQDGMTIEDLHKHNIPQLFTQLFVGGTLDWKWKTASMWVDYAHHNGMKLHIGRCGTLPRLLQAEKMGADSVDSTSIARNDSWDTIRELRQTTAGPLWRQEVKGEAC